MKVSENGTSSATIASMRLLSPVPSLAMPPNSSPGSVVERSIAPPMVLRPNSVPCGPRSTCTFEMSRNCIEPPTALPMYTSSMYMPTPGSTVEVGSVCPMPRMNTCEDELLPASGALLANCRFGTTWSSTSVEKICRSSSATPDSAVIEIGVLCRFSSTLRAVTVISSRPSTPCSCASTVGASATALAAARTWLMARHIGLVFTLFPLIEIIPRLRARSRAPAPVSPSDRPTRAHCLLPSRRSRIADSNKAARAGRNARLRRYAA